MEYKEGTRESDIQLSDQERGKVDKSLEGSVRLEREGEEGVTITPRTWVHSSRRGIHETLVASGERTETQETFDERIEAFARKFVDSILATDRAKEEMLLNICRRHETDTPRRVLGRNNGANMISEHGISKRTPFHEKFREVCTRLLNERINEMRIQDIVRKDPATFAEHKELLNGKTYVGEIRGNGRGQVGRGLRKPVLELTGCIYRTEPRIKGRIEINGYVIQSKWVRA